MIAEEQRARPSRLIPVRLASRRPGPAGNERLTATTAVVLLVLLAAEGLTIVALRPLLSVHVFLGMLLVPPVGLKLASTGWRFFRYYRGDRAYVLRGAPRPLLRFVVAPAVVCSTLGLFASGVALIAFGPGHPLVVGLHKASFIVWFGAMTVHVLAHALRLPRLAGGDLRRRTRVHGAALRAWALAASLVAGATLAVWTLPLAHAWHGWVGGG
jgi:hypothetical protein